MNNLDVSEVIRDQDERNANFRDFGKYDVTPEERESAIREAKRGKILAIEDRDERIDVMLESGEFTRDEVIEEIYRHPSDWRLRQIQKHPDLFGVEFSEPEAVDTRSVEEVYGGPVSVSYTGADGKTITRSASREEADRLRREEILAIEDTGKRLEAIARNADLF